MKGKKKEEKTVDKGRVMPVLRTRGGTGPWVDLTHELDTLSQHDDWIRLSGQQKLGRRDMQLSLLRRCTLDLLPLLTRVPPGES